MRVYKYKLSDEEQAEVCKRYLEGKSANKLSKVFGLSQSNIIEILKRNNIPRRSLSESGKGRKFTEEHRKNLAKSKIGEMNPAKRPDVREKISKTLMGHSHNKGIPKSEETKEKLRKANTGKKRSEETKRKHSETNKKLGRFVGENNPSKRPEVRKMNSERAKLRKNELNSNWKGGKSFEPYPMEFTQDLKKEVRKRDNYTCQLCGVRKFDGKTRMCVHHIDYDKENCSVTNLITLCSGCHMKTNGNREHWKNFFSLIMENKYG